MRFATAVLAYAVAGLFGARVARSAKVPDPPFRWKRLKGPWFDNNVALLEDREEGLYMQWATGVVDDDLDRPRLETVEEIVIRPRR